MKKMLFLVSLLVLLACGENDNMYQGEQFFSFGQRTTMENWIGEETSLVEVPFGLAYPATEDLFFQVEIVANTLPSGISIQGESTGLVSLVLKKGEQLGKLEVDINFDELVSGDVYHVGLQLKNPELINCVVMDSTASLTIQKYCKIEDMKDWEGKYTNGQYQMTIKHLNGDTLQLNNLLNLEVTSPERKPAPVKLIVDDSTKPVTVYVVEGYFYLSGTGDPIEIRNNYYGDPYYGSAYFCEKQINLVFLQLVGGSYYLGELPIWRIGNLDD